MKITKFGVRSVGGDREAEASRGGVRDTSGPKVSSLEEGPLAGLRALQHRRSPGFGAWGLDRFGITDDTIHGSSSVVAGSDDHGSLRSRIDAPAVQEQATEPRRADVGAPRRSTTVPDPGFRLPRRKWPLGQPFKRSKPGPTANEANTSIRPFASAAWAGNVSLVKTNPLSPPTASTDFAIAAYSFGGLHELVGGLFNFHALAASLRKRDRYGLQVDTMLKADVAAFTGSSRENDGSGVRSSDARHLETLMLKRENEKGAADADGRYVLRGKFIYDMDKVETLAAMDDLGQPEHMKNAIAHARNVFLMVHIRDEVAAKRAKRALYDGVRNVIGIAGASVLATGTHGAAVPAALAAKQAGYSLLAGSALDPAKMVRGYKQRYRDEKAKQIEDGTLALLAPYTTHFGLHPGIFETAATESADAERCRQLIKAYQAVLDTENGSSTDAKRWVAQTAAGTLAVTESEATRRADKMRFGRFGLKGGMFNQQKNSGAKRDRTDLAAKHVARIADYHLGEFCADVAALDKMISSAAEPDNTVSFRKKVALQRETIKRDEHLRPVYDLLRDIGFGRTEATITLSTALNRHWSASQNVPSGLLPLSIRRDVLESGGHFTRDGVSGIGDQIKNQR